ncbi:MAG: nucleotidyltransferase family protein [Candidatus Latescibacterota bacterium]
MDKVLVLARGLGTRMRREDPRATLTREQEEVAATGVKALIPIRRPFLEYVLTAVADAGYRRICLVVGPEHEELRRYYGEALRYARLQVEFAVQQQPLGTANAVAAGEAFAGDGPFLMINSDNYYPVEALEAMRRLEGPGLPLFSRQGMLAGSNIPAERLLRFAVVEVGADGYMKRIIEKPSPAQVAALPEPVGVSMNCWRFDARIFAACRVIPPSPRGELEITDAVQHAIDRLGVRFRAVPCTAAVLDLSSRDDVAGVARLLEGKEVRV